MGDDERGRDDDWCDDVETQVYSFKRKVHCWLREDAQRDKSSMCSLRSSRSVSDKGSMNSKKSKDANESRSSRSSRSSRASREARSSKSSKGREKEEKMKVAKSTAKAELLQQKQMIQNEADKLKIKERLVKAKARIQHRTTGK